MGTYEDSGFDEYMNRPFEGLSSAPREFQEQTGYSYGDLVAHMENTGVHAQTFTTTIAFTSDDYQTVSWGTGTIEYKDGKVTPTIAASNTGKMSTRTYIYYDPQADKVALQTTTIASIATKGERLLLAIAVNNSNTNGMAEVQTFGATGMYIGELTMEHLTSGSIRSKTVSLVVTPNAGDCYFNAGKTDFTNTDGGFILGIDDSDSDKAKFYIGDATNYLNWTGSGLVIKIAGDFVNTNVAVFSHLSIEHFWTESNTYEDRTGCRFMLDGDDFGNQSVYYECVMANEQASRTAYTQIYNITDSSALSGSELTSTVEPLTALERVRSSALTFPSGEKEYKLQIKMNQTGGSGDNAHFYAARLVIIQA